MQQRRKNNHYVGFQPELYDLVDDPFESLYLAGQAASAETLRALEAELRAIWNPEDVDRRAKRDQATLVESHGVRDAVVKIGGFSATLPSGETPEYASGGN